MISISSWTVPGAAMTKAFGRIPCSNVSLIIPRAASLFLLHFNVSFRFCRKTPAARPLFRPRGRTGFRRLLADVLDLHLDGHGFLGRAVQRPRRRRGVAVVPPVGHAH